MQLLAPLAGNCPTPLAPNLRFVQFPGRVRMFQPAYSVALIVRVLLTPVAQNLSFYIVVGPIKQRVAYHSHPRT